MRNFFLFLLREHFFFLFFVLEIISFILIIQNNYYQKSVFINSSNELAGNVFSTFNNISQYFSLKDENKRLSKENAKLLNEAKKFYIINNNNIFQHYDTIFHDDTLYSQQYEFISAKVINSSVNKRHKDSKISAKIKKNGHLGTVIWNGGDYCMAQLIDVPTHVKLTIGDTIISSGNSTSFPEGILIGTILNYKIEKGDNFYSISIKLSTDFNNISYAYIIKNIMKDELDKIKKRIND